MKTVDQAEAHDIGRMSSVGNAARMLMCQHQFPDTYDDDEEVIHQDHDRIQLSEREHFEACVRKHFQQRVWDDLGYHLRTMRPEKILPFLCDLLKVPQKQKPKCVGFRVLGTVHRGNRAPVWGLEVFIKNPNSTTRLYDTNTAPNLIQGSRYME